MNGLEIKLEKEMRVNKRLLEDIAGNSICKDCGKPILQCIWFGCWSWTI